MMSEVITGVSPTKYFKYVFMTLEDFTSFLEEYTDVESSDIMNAYCYKYLYARFGNTSIGYYEVASFLRQFGLTYENFFNRFKMQRQIVDSLYDININDLITSQIFISNIANNPNDMPENPLDNALNFVSQQTSSKITSNKLESYFKSLQMISDNLLDEFLEQFRKHFISILIRPEKIFIDEEIIEDEEDE